MSHEYNGDSNIPATKAARKTVGGVRSQGAGAFGPD